MIRFCTCKVVLASFRECIRKKKNCLVEEDASRMRFSKKDLLFPPHTRHLFGVVVVLDSDKITNLCKFNNIISALWVTFFEHRKSILKCESRSNG